MSRRPVPMLLLVALAGCGATLGGERKAEVADPPALQLQLARSLAAHREWAAAARALVRLKDYRPAATPEGAEVRALLATAYREQGLLDEAEAEYRAALRAAPGRADLWGGLGVLRDLRGDAGDEAVSDLERAVSLDPESVAQRNNLGFAYYLRGRLAEASAAFREALRRDPSARRVRNNLGFACGRQGDVEAARREFERGGTRAEARANLAWVYERLGDRAAACALYREAAGLDPSLAPAIAGVGAACPPPEVAVPAAAAPAPRERAERSTRRRTP